MAFTTLFCDLDDTLYPSDNGLWNAIGLRMNQFMVEKVGLPSEQVPLIRRHYYETYGTTMRGLQIHHQVDADEYLAYVHDLPLEQFLKPDPDLRNIFSSLPQKRWIFTNADAGHAGRVLSVLDLDDCFDGIIDVRAIQFACKPELRAYTRALELAGNPTPGGCVIFDDSAANLAPAREIGLHTIWVTRKATTHPAADCTLSSLLELPAHMPELWDGVDSR